MSGGTQSGGFPGMLSQFDISAFNTGLPGAEAAMTNRYSQLGLGQTGATPSSPGSFGTGGTAMGMDLGALPSVGGGIPAAFQAGAGQLQTQDIGQTLQLALNNLTASNTNKSNLLSGITK